MATIFKAAVADRLIASRIDVLRRQVRVDRKLFAARAGIPEFGPPDAA